jgi:hypothetical protein
MVIDSMMKLKKNPNLTKELRTKIKNKIIRTKVEILIKEMITLKF